MPSSNISRLLGVTLTFVCACTATYIFFQRYEIIGLNEQIRQLRIELNCLSNLQNEAHQLSASESVPNVLSPNPPVQFIQHNSQAEQEEKEKNSKTKGRTHLSRRNLKTRKSEPSRSRRLMSSSKSNSKSKSKGKSDMSYDFREGDSAEGLGQFVEDLLRGLEEISTKTAKLDQLTDELGNITQTLDNRRLTEVVSNDQSFTLHVRQMQQISNQTQFESNYLALTDGLNESINRVDVQNNRLSLANSRMTELNTVLRDSVTNATARNANLQQQNQNLELSVAHLTGEVERLQDEKDRLLQEIQDLSGEAQDLNTSLGEYAALNAQLSASISNLSKENHALNEDNVWYSELNSQLNESIEQLQVQNEFIGKQNEIYKGLNTDLNVTAENLSGQVDRLEGSVDDLENQNNRLNLVVGELTDEIEILADENINLEKSVGKLSSEVDRLSNETDRLERANNDLSNVVSFLDETANDMDESFDAITSFLSEQIAAYRNVVVETLHNTYLQRIDKWDCGLQSAFNDQNFANNENAAIPNSVLPRIMDYVEEQVLSELCLNATDFESYMENRFGQPVFTISHFVSAVQGYTSEAINYYFPDEVENGLTEIDWADAEYSCEKLHENKRFSWTNGES